MSDDSEKICKSIFKSNTENEKKEKYIKLWAEIINRKEKSKSKGMIV